MVKHVKSEFSNIKPNELLLNFFCLNQDCHYCRNFNVNSKVLDTLSDIEKQLWITAAYKYMKKQVVCQR